MIKQTLLNLKQVLEHLESTKFEFNDSKALAYSEFYFRVLLDNEVHLFAVGNNEDRDIGILKSDRITRRIIK